MYTCADEILQNHDVNSNLTHGLFNETIESNFWPVTDKNGIIFWVKPIKMFVCDT